MFISDAPKTKDEAKKYRYNVWAGNPRGTQFNPERCAFERYSSDRFGMFYQCSRKPGHGPDSLYCKQHAKQVAEEGASNG
jgi:hypothetical protein